MADEEHTEEAPETAAEAPAADAPVEEPAAEPTMEDAAPAPEADQAVEGEVAGDEPSAAAQEPEAPAAPPAPPQLHPKERRRQARSRHAGTARQPRTPEERRAERVAERAKKAVSRRAGRAKLRAKARERRAATPAMEPAHAPEHGSGRPKQRQGVVVSDKGDKTITVRIDVTRRHRRYGKIQRSSSKLHAHDERNEAHAGDTVRVVETRPMSRTKRWRLVEVVERAK